MKDKLLTFVDSVKALWHKTSKKMRVLVLSVTAAILAVSLVVVIMLNRKDYVVLYDNLTTVENAEVIAQLQEMGVQGSLEGTQLMVPKEEEDRVRMQLAANGYRSSGLDYSIFEKGTALTATQWDKQKWDRNYLQNRLQATIETFEEVSEATVTIAMPEQKDFVLQEDMQETRATVKLRVRPGRELTANQIQGIINIVRDSVPGLEEENISISDQSGDLLGTLALGRDAASTKLELTEQVNETVRRRIMNLLTPIYGDDGVHVAVNTVLDTDQRVTERKTYEPLDPENPTNNPLDYVETGREKTGPGGVAQGVPGANDNIQVPEYLALDADADTADYYSSHNIFDYLVGSTQEQIISEGLHIQDITVAVLVDRETLANDEISQVRNLVMRAAGIQPEDENNVTVMNMQFQRADRPSGIGGADGEVNWGIWIAVIGLIVGALLILLLVILSMRKKRREQMLAESEDALDDATLIDLVGADEEFEPIAIPESNEQKLKAQIKDLASSDPEIVAQLIKTWLMAE